MNKEFRDQIAAITREDAVQRPASGGHRAREGSVVVDGNNNTVFYGVPSNRGEQQPRDQKPPFLNFKRLFGAYTLLIFLPVFWLSERQAWGATFGIEPFGKRLIEYVLVSGPSFGPMITIALASGLIGAAAAGATRLLLQPARGT